MNTNEWFRNKLGSLKDDFEFRLETIILDLTEKISKRMKEKNLNRTNLAELLKVSPPAVTKILNGNSNFTLKTLLSLADALQLQLKIDFKEKGVVTSKKISPPFVFAFTIASGSPVSTSIYADASITSPFPFHETGRRDLAEAVNA